MSMYTALKFNNHKDFLAYANTVKLEPENVALSKDFKIIVLIETKLPMPTGSLMVETKEGRKITIHVFSGLMGEIFEEKNP